MPTPPHPRHRSIYDKNVKFKTQQFSFSFSTMNYLIEKSDPNVLEKLQKTCKYFYLKRQIFITKSLSLLDVAHNSFINPKDLDFIKSKLWLTGYLSFWLPLSVPQFLTRIYKCELSSLYIYSGKVHLTYSDLKFLTNSGTIEKLLIMSKVYESENKIIPVHQILALVPKAFDIQIMYVNVEQNGMEQFLKIERKVKLKTLHLLKINRMLDPHLFLEFFKKNLTANAYFIIKFETNAMTQEFRNTVDPQIRSLLRD